MSGQYVSAMDWVALHLGYLVLIWLAGAVLAGGVITGRWLAIRLFGGSDRDDFA